MNLFRDVKKTTRSAKGDIVEVTVGQRADTSEEEDRMSCGWAFGRVRSTDSDLYAVSSAASLIISTTTTAPPLATRRSSTPR